MTSPYYAPDPTFTPLPEDQALKVRADTNPGSLAKSLVLTLHERPSGVVKVRAMGPGPVNQMVKALIIARQQLVGQGKDYDLKLGFETRVEVGESITVIQATVKLVD